MARIRYIAEAVVALGGATAFALFATREADRLYDLSNALATVSGVLFGFLLAAVAILASLPDRRLVINIRRTGHYGALMRGAFLACGAHFAALVVSLLALFSEGAVVQWLLCTAIAAEIFAVLRTAQCGNRFRILFDAMDGGADR